MEYQEITLEDVMQFRDLKNCIQETLIKNGKQSVVISLGMNIPGPRKTGPSIKAAFEEGRNQLECLVKENEGKLLKKIVLEESAGYAAIYLVANIDVAGLKTIGVQLEEHHALGRLFDIDVFSEEGQSISREFIGAEKRKCMICSEDAKVCGRSRKHTIAELQEKVSEIISQWKESSSYV